MASILKANVSITSLPVELIIQILKKSHSFDEIYAAAATSRFFHDVFEEHWHVILWGNLQHFLAKKTINQLHAVVIFRQNSFGLDKTWDFYEQLSGWYSGKLVLEGKTPVYRQDILNLFVHVRAFAKSVTSGFPPVQLWP